MYPIATTTVGAGGATSITFSSIPQNFTHLHLRAFTRGVVSSGTNIPMQFNGDGTSGNYITHYVGGTGAATFSGSTGGNANIGWTMGTTDTANGFGASIVDILDYTNTNKNKTVRTLNGVVQDATTGTGLLGLWSGLWISTAAINSINISLSSTPLFAQYSTFQLYGITTA